MLSINKRTVQKSVTMEQLFSMVGHKVKPDHTTDISTYGVSVKTEDGYKPLKACYTTEPLPLGVIEFQNGTKLDCAQKHLVMTSVGWRYVGDLDVGTIVLTDSATTIVSKAWSQAPGAESVILGDVEVDSEEHSYYTNGIQSHNTHCLVNLGANALVAGKNVFHYSLELNERMVGIRYDSNLTNITSTDCFEAKDAIKQYFSDNKESLGRLIIKEFPARTITTSTLRAHIEKMGYKGIRPDLVVVDYAGIMRSTEKYELARFELMCVVQELRAFAREMNLPVWTALQSNKDGAKSEIIDVTNMAESYGQAAEADFVLGLQRMSTQKSTGYGTLFIAKNRFGVDGLQFKIHLDTSRSKLRILSQAEIDAAHLDSEVEQQQLGQEVLAQFRESIKKRKEQFTKLGANNG